jgi:hypothetical protein
VREVEAVRTRALDTVRHLMARTGMHATNGAEAESVAGGLLGDLCFIDEREADHERMWRDVLHRHGSLGVAGAFSAMFGERGRYDAEVVSVYAQAFTALGYLALDRRLSVSELTSVHDAALGYQGKDARRSDVVRDVGEPSLTVDRRILCYAGEDDEGWIAFDCWEPYTPLPYDPRKGSFSSARPDDPLLRAVRVPADTFAEGVVLTRYGHVLQGYRGQYH